MKRILSVFLSMVIIASCVTALPFTAMADEGSGSVGFVENPVYSKKTRVSAYSRSVPVKTDILNSASYVRDKMVSRTRSFQISFNSSAVLNEANIGLQIEELFMEATSDELSVSTVDGDYIRWQFKGYSYDYSYSKSSDGSYDYILDLIFLYNDSAREEQQIDKVIQNYLSSIDFSAYSDYELLKEFHDFVLESCEYDDNYFLRTDRYDFSIYGVFGLGRAVCQGYALAFYRLCKEAGFDVRFVSSDPNEGCHAWNLVNIGGAYYYVDCTWDDVLDDRYALFLVDYETLQKYDSYNYEHKLYNLYYGDSYFEDNYGQYISDSSWSTDSKNLGNCIVSADYTSITDTDGAILENGSDYTISRSNPEYDAVITGTGDYSGSFLKKKSLVYATKLSLSYTSTSYSNEEKKPKVTFGNLIEGKNFTVVYSDNINIGTAVVMVRASGKYCGFAIAEFTIKAADINKFNIRLTYTQMYYDGYEKRPAVVIDNLVQGRDYTVSYSSNINPGTGYVIVKGINNYCGTAKKGFEIKKESIAGRKITLSKTSYIYNGNVKKPGVSVSGLTQGSHYKVSYSSNTLPGIARVTITGTGYFTGTVTKTFKIYPSQVSSFNAGSSTDTSVALKWKKVSGVSGYYIERYSSGKWVKAADVASDKKSTTVKKLSACTAYKFRIRAYKTVNGQRLYGEKSEYLTVYTRPKKVSIKKPSTSKKSITVKWSKTKASGYQIEYSAYSDFKKSKKVTVSGENKTSKKISSLVKGRKYYVRVRAYKTVNGKKYYGTWSSKKSITCK